MSPRATLFVAFAFAAAAPAFAACELHAASDLGGAPPPPTVYDASPADAAAVSDASTGEDSAGDASAGEGNAADAWPESAGASGYEGSPLCNASPSKGVCYPDNPATAVSCNLAPDGGAYEPDSGYDLYLLGCHVESSASGADTHAACLPVGPGTDGSPCVAPTDCGPGFECIGTGTCRRYCCQGEAVCQANAFCDIQSVAVPAQTKVPVCMPIDKCNLLDARSCPPMQTCAVVQEDGGSSCVATGAAKAGDGCDEDHCGVDLVCLGVPGQRRCYQLCHPATPEEACSPMQTCKGGLPLFPDPSIGICQ